MSCNRTEGGRRAAPVCGLRPAAERADLGRQVVIERREHFRRLIAAAQARRPDASSVERARAAGVSL